MPLARVDGIHVVFYAFHIAELRFHDTESYRTDKEVS